MMGKTVLRVGSMMVLCLGLSASSSVATEFPGIPPETVADYIHAVIEADRTFYTIHVVERMQKQGGVPAAENWRAEKKTLPLPAQFLAEASDLASKTGTKVRYRLISLWPINPHNGPDDESEKKGLEAVREHPERSATSTVRARWKTVARSPVGTAWPRRSPASSMRARVSASAVKRTS